MAIDRQTDSIESIMNDLYWGTSRTIDEITGELGVGRNTLYASIRPLGVGMLCPRCSDALFFTNRTHRAAGSATCLSCGAEASVNEMDSGNGSGAENRQAMGDRMRNGISEMEEERRVDTDRVALIGGGAALGILLGSAAIRALRS